jgi:hypothetical protein
LSIPAPHQRLAGSNLSPEISIRGTLASGLKTEREGEPRAGRGAAATPGFGYNQLMSSSDQSSRERARRRSAWPVRSFRLGEEPGDDLSETTTVGERLSMMWPLAVEAWTLSGRELPTYERRHLPTRLYRPGEIVPDDGAAS